MLGRGDHLALVIILPRLPLLNIIKDLEIDIPENAVDRAHRVGKKKDVNGNVTQPIIVRFNSFSERTNFYKSRKAVKDRFKYGVSLDLTKSRLGLLKEARTIVENNVNVKFAYSDINCYLRVCLTNGKHLSFSSISELEDIMVSL